MNLFGLCYNNFNLLKKRSLQNRTQTLPAFRRRHTHTTTSHSFQTHEPILSLDFLCWEFSEQKCNKKDQIFQSTQIQFSCIPE
ncbi:hypothetical protein ACOSQ3_009406 [Xanthoceras sorbifolium]